MRHMDIDFIYLKNNYYNIKIEDEIVLVIFFIKTYLNNIHCYNVTK